MNTTSTFCNETLTIAIMGHIDSEKATSLQDEICMTINKYEGEMKYLVLDAKQLTFISSLGLRCILQIKKDYPQVRIVNCSAEVFNVFKMTGFTKVIDVTKALQNINTECLLPVEGMPSTYHLSDETMVRVFPQDATLSDVENMVQLGRKLFIMEVPTVMTFEIVKAGLSYGLVFESVKIKDIDALTLGKMARQLHKHIVEPDDIIPSAKERERQRILEMKEEKGEDAVKKILQVLNTIPDGSSLLHGNFSASNIAFSIANENPVIADMSTICYGNPIFDMTHLYLTLPEEEREQYLNTFIHSYYSDEDEDTIARIIQNITTLARAHYCFCNGISDQWDEIFSNLHFKMDFAEEIRKLERNNFYLNSDVNIDWVAGTLGTNRHYVSDYFNKVLHTSFSDYINNLRLEYAVELMRSGRIPMSQISYSAGFNSDHTFRRLFKQKYGCTPSQFM